MNDINIVAIRPVKIPTELVAMTAAMGVVSGVPTYNDSIVIPCPKCGEDCYLGPKGKELIDAGKGEALCWMCLIQDMHSNGLYDDPTMTHLGNTDLFKPEN